MKKLLPFLFLCLLGGCKTQDNLPVKENPPTVITKPATNVSLNSITFNGEVADEGFSSATNRGFVYSDKNLNPSVSDFKVQSGFGKGIYSVKVDNLSNGTKYYFNTYATNSKGTSYGEVQNVITLDYNFPTAKTEVPQNITYYSADFGGSILDDGGIKVTERGICYGFNPNPTILDNKVTTGEGVGTFNISLKNLKGNSKYYIRAYAINSRGAGYGNEQTFTTLNAPEFPRDNITKVVEVKSKTGRIWMDRNLGATQAATSKTDVNSYGDLYQWGRGYDGHQFRTSGTTFVVSSSDTPGNSDFILPSNNPMDWRSTQTIYLWQGVNGVNNPCPKGFRLPSKAEWDEEYRSWSSLNSDGAFASPLKLPLGGYRSVGDGELKNVGKMGQYWSSTTNTSGTLGPLLLFYGIIFEGATDNANIGTTNRGNGNCVRCIKD